MNLRTSLALGLVASFGLPQLAEAHVNITGATGPAIGGQTAELVVNVPHGCGVEADGMSVEYDTIAIELQIPAEVTSVRAMDSEFGKATFEKNAEGKITKVIWTRDVDANPPQDGLDYFYKLGLRVGLPNTPFKKLFFPTVQKCANDTQVAWVATDGDHDHGGGHGSAGDQPAPSVFLWPARSPGWNKYTVTEHVHDLTVFKDAEIVWSGNQAYSFNPETLKLIQAEQGVQVLEQIHPGTEIWVKY
jgi:uncharacterized protein YcnI